MALAVGLILFLAAYNNVTNLARLPEWTYVPLNVATGVALLAVARGAGHSWEELGFAATGLVPGVIVGAGMALVVAAVLALLATNRRTARYLLDRRVLGLSRGELAFRTAVRIPVGTALFEEVAFRGVLLAVLSAAWSTPVAVAGSSVVFGVWHVVPSAQTLEINRLARSRRAEATVVSAAVAASAVAGVGFCLLRIWTGGIVAPVLLHAAINSSAVLASYAAHRRAALG